MIIDFYKYQGTGNDFVILDNRQGKYSNLTQDQIKSLCSRQFGIGADGLMIFQNREGYDFEMVYYNADGHAGSLCGNGSRCIVKFASDQGLLKMAYNFLTCDGPHTAEVNNKGLIRIKMNDVTDVDYLSQAAVLDTGSPHYVRFSSNVNELDVVTEGREIRYGKKFNEKGINVNFVEQIGDDTIFVRTYERGVENETLSCGTGVTASALVSAHNPNGFNNVSVQTKGGKLSVEFEKISEEVFENIWLTGPAKFVFKGTIAI